jgi:hypothetical protein
MLQFFIIIYHLKEMSAQKCSVKIHLDFLEDTHQDSYGDSLKLLLIKSNILNFFHHHGKSGNPRIDLEWLDLLSVGVFSEKNQTFASHGPSKTRMAKDLN